VLGGRRCRRLRAGGRWGRERRTGAVDRPQAWWVFVDGGGGGEGVAFVGGGEVGRVGLGGGEVLWEKFGVWAITDSKQQAAGSKLVQIGI